MQQLLKPSINIDFTDAQMEDANDYQPMYSLEFMKAKREEMRHANKFAETKKKIIPKAVPQRPMSAQAKKQQNHSAQKHKFLVKKEQNHTAQISPVVSTSKSVRFGKTYVSETVPVISSHYETEALLKKQTPVSGTIDPKTAKTQQQPIQTPVQIIPSKMKSEQEALQKIGILEWDEDLDDQFYIKDAKKLLTSNVSSKMLTIEKTNRENFIKKFKAEDNVQKPITNNEVLKQQQKQIQEKIENIQQLRMNEILSKQLVISQVPNQEEEEQYDNDFEQEVEINQVKNLPAQINKSQEEEYGNEEFEAEEEQPKVEEKKIEVKKVEIKKPKQTPAEKPKKQRTNVYRAKNAKERKQELLNMRSELEKQLLDNNEGTAKLYKQLQDTTENERIMIEVNTKRKEELAQAQLTLQQLREKLEQQQQIIEELDKKEHYAQQIIEKLQENKYKFQQQYDQEIEKFLACKVIARFLRGFKDRKLYQEMKRQRFMNKINK